MTRKRSIIRMMPQYQGDFKFIIYYRGMPAILFVVFFHWYPTYHLKKKVFFIALFFFGLRPKVILIFVANFLYFLDVLSHIGITFNISGNISSFTTL